MDFTFDKMFYERGELIGGIDESGVSDMAGPLVAACVVIPHIDLQRDDLRILDIDDSKKIPKRYLAQHAEVIWQAACAIGIGVVVPSEINYLGKYEAIRIAMMRAIASCRKTTASKRIITPDFLLIDGELQLPIEIPHQLIHHADTKSLCVAAASIVAKVFRDRTMLELHDKTPYYGWDSNKGYPCEMQFQGIDQYGIQPDVHRVKLWPFVPNPRFPEDRARWRQRRSLWRRQTEARLLAELRGPCSTENSRSTRCLDSKDSNEPATTTSTL